MAPYLGSPDETSDRPRLQQIHCSGSPYEIGYKHGSEAKVQVGRTIDFYTNMFRQTSSMEWDQVRELATTYEPVIRQKWPQYLEEMRGVADGAGVGVLDIVACNVRTEIAFGMFDDGCTALSWLTDDASFLAQNWDWQEAQKQNLIVLTIDQSNKPTIKMVTEAGLIGKIGLNSAGVGVCLNAIKMKGHDPDRLPCHLGLRMVLDSSSREEAVQRLEQYGVASACHMLIADDTGGVGLEWSSTDVQKCPMNDHKQVFHSNHYLLKHQSPDTPDESWAKDTMYRVTRIEELANGIKGSPTRDSVFELFKDETHYPGSICRAQKPPSRSATLFNIVMDSKAKRANITLGRPVDPDESVELSF